MPSSFKTPLRLEYVDGRNFTVLEPFSFWWELAGQELIIHVPAGFSTDFASVPRGLWNLCPPHGLYGKAAVIHDYCYRTGCVPRDVADLLFVKGMAILGVPGWRRWLMYWAVRLFGRRAYQGVR